MTMFSALLFPEKPGNINFVHIASPMTVSIPKSSALIAAVKDSQIKAFEINVDEFSELNTLPATALKSDEEYVRPKVLHLKEGLSLSKEDYILGRVKFIDHEKDVLKITKEDAKPYTEREEVTEITDNDYNQWMNIAREEEKNRIISSLGASNNPRLYNRLSNLNYYELTDIRDTQQSFKDPVLEEIEKNIANASVPNSANPSIKISATNPGATSGYKWSTKIDPTQLDRKPSSAPRSEIVRKPELNPLVSNVYNLAGLYSDNYSEPNQSLMTSGYAYESLDIAKDESSLLPVERRVTGEIRFGNGLAYLGPNSKLEIYHIDQNGNKVPAEKNFEKAEYWVDIKSDLNYLIAEYRDASGQLLGFFQKNISELKEKLVSNIELNPVNWGFNVELIGKLKEEITRFWIDGIEQTTIKESIFVDETWTHYSNFLIGLKPENGPYISQIVSSKQNNYLETYSDKHIDEIAEILRDQGHYMDRSLGVVVGELKNLEDLSGFEVEITDDQAIGPIYFNDFMIPDSLLKRTSYSGLFMFVNVSPDNHQVRVRNSNIIVSSLGTVGYNSLTKYDFDLSQTKKIKLAVKDIFSGGQLKSTFQIPGAEDLFQSETVDSILLTYLENKAQHNLEFWAGENYLPVRWSFTDRREFIASKVLSTISKDVLSEHLDITKPIIHIANISSVFGFSFNHRPEILNSMKLVGVNTEGLIEEFRAEAISSYEHIFAQGLPAGLHSVQFYLSENLKSNQVFLLSDSTISLIEP